MAQVRGAVVSGTVNFVRDAYGPDANERVLATLAPADRAAIARPVRDTAFLPLAPLVAYIEADRRRIRELVERSLMLVTALNPRIGYDNAAKIAKLAHAENLTLRDAALKLGLLSSAELDQLLRPEQMLGPKE